MSVTVTIAKNTFFNGLTTWADVALNFLVSILLARGLGVEQYGTYSYLMWLLSLLAIIANLGLGDMVARFIAEAEGEKDKKKSLVIAQLGLVLRPSAAAIPFVLLLAFPGFWARLLGVPAYQPYFVLLAFAFVPFVLNTIMTSIFAGFQKYEYSAYLMLATNPVRAIAIIAVVLLGHGIRELLIVNMAAWVLGVMGGLFLLRRLVPVGSLLSLSKVDRAIRKGALKYAFAAAAVLILNYFIWQKAETFFLGLYRPGKEVGFYSLASNLPSQVMALIPMALGQVLFPAVSEMFGRGDMAKIRTIYLTSARYLTMIALPLAAGGMALSQTIVLLLYGKEYLPVVPAMSLLWFSFAVMALAYSPWSIIYGTNRPLFALKAGLLLAALNIGFCFWLIPRYGIMGAAIGSSIPRMLSLVFYLVFVHKKIRAAWPIKDTVRIALASGVMALAVFAIGRQLQPGLALAVAIPVGVAIYVAALLKLGALREQDSLVMVKVQSAMPPLLRAWSAPVVNLTERLVCKKLAEQRPK